MQNEKDMFVTTWEHESPTTLKVLKAYPTQRSKYRPHELSKSAVELAWVFVSEEQVFVNGVMTGKFDFESMPKAPETMEEVIEIYEKHHAALVKKIKDLGEEDLKGTVPFMTGPKQMGEVGKMQALWMMLMDQVHHRGQFSVYVRMAGGKVPSIYGPSADEPWM